MTAWPGSIRAITLLVDLDAARRFYSEVLGLPTHFKDDASAVFRFGNTLINVLKTDAAPELIAPAQVTTPGDSARMQLTIGVDDVDPVCEQLASSGVELLNGPMDRPWGLRTASFRDPGGHIWEIAH